MFLAATVIKCGGQFRFCISSNFHGGFSTKEQPGTGNFMVSFLLDENLRKELKSLVEGLNPTKKVRDIEALNRYWGQERAVNRIAPLSTLLATLRSSGQKDIPRPGAEAIRSTGWDWEYAIDFDTGEFHISFGSRYSECWRFEHIPGRHEIYGSLFGSDSDDAMKARILKLLGRTKDDAEKSSSMKELENTVDWWF